MSMPGTSAGLRRAPTPQGWALLMAAPALFLLAVNYSSNLVFTLSFLVLSLMINAGIATWRGLDGIEGNLAPVAPAFAGEPLTLTARLSGPATRRWAVRLRALGRSGPPAGEAPDARLDLCTAGRGPLALGIPELETRDALGLFRVRRALGNHSDDAGIEAMIWPAPDWTAPAEGVETGLSGGRAWNRDEIAGLRPWRHGDTPVDMAWRATMRRGEPIVRDYEAGHARGARLFSWSGVAGAGPEAGLSRLSAGVISANRQGLAAGLDLPGLRIDPAEGEAQLGLCLDALARHGGRTGRLA